ncbi:MAG: S1 RNA-binding domain-containing protein [Acidimicrobiales bacterium]
MAIASVDSGAVAEAERQIKLILDPPTAEVGETYTGRVVNITKFGAFVNILPGRDGLVHISKLGGGRRIDRVEDVVDLGDEMEVVVEDVDPNGKISLRPVGSEPRGDGGGRGRSSRDHRDRGGSSDDSGDSADRTVVSFEEAFDAELEAEFGDLGPEPARRGGGTGGGGTGGGATGGGGRGRGRGRR